MDHNQYHNFNGGDDDVIMWKNNGGYDTYKESDITDGDFFIDYGQEANGQAGDPLFVNKAADDYTLQSGSPCIDAGALLAYLYLHPHSDWPNDVKTMSGDEIGGYGYPDEAVGGVTITGVTIQ